MRLRGRRDRRLRMLDELVRHVHELDLARDPQRHRGDRSGHRQVEHDLRDLRPANLDRAVEEQEGRDQQQDPDPGDDRPRDERAGVLMDPAEASAVISTSFPKRNRSFPAGLPIHGHIRRDKNRPTQDRWRGGPHATAALSRGVADCISQTREPSAHWLVQTARRL